ncbi:hypothetical protein PIROE2DRAFT_37470, partial [Piromyces sp. E2]
MACEFENETIVKYLIEHGADVNIKNLGSDVLRNACCKENETIIEILIENGVDVNQSDHGRYCDTPLIIACRNGKENIVKYLVDHGADVNKKNEAGESPL